MSYRRSCIAHIVVEVQHKDSFTYKGGIGSDVSVVKPKQRLHKSSEIFVNLYVVLSYHYNIGQTRGTRIL